MKPLNDVDMAADCGLIHGNSRAAFSSMLVESLDDFEMAICRAIIHRLLDAFIRPILEHPLDNFKVV